MAKILIAEDEKEIAELEKDYLVKYGYECEIVGDGVSARDRFLSGEFDLLVLDIMLPKMNGYDVCKQVRAKCDLPIIMVTARGEPTDVVLGLGLGAEDYLRKPFDPAEMVARVSAHLATYERLKGSGEKNADKKIIVKDVTIELQSRRVFKGETELRLPNKEFELLAFLAQNANIVFTKEYLFEKIWGFDYVGDSATVTVHVNRIREKIDPDGSEKIIETVRGAGYRLSKK